MVVCVLSSFNVFIMVYVESRMLDYLCSISVDFVGQCGCMLNCDSRLEITIQIA